RIRAAGVTARPRCRHFLIAYRWRRKSRLATDPTLSSVRSNPSYYISAALPAGGAPALRAGVAGVRVRPDPQVAQQRTATCGSGRTLTPATARSAAPPAGKARRRDSRGFFVTLRGLRDFS